MKYITIFLLLILLSSCSRLSTQYFSIEVPRNWHSVERTDKSVKLERKNSRNVTIYITANKVPKGLTLEENWKDYYRFVTFDKKVINQFEKTYNGVVWNGVITETFIKTEYMFTIKNNVRCIIIYGTEKNDFEKGYGEFQSFMENVKL